MANLFIGFPVPRAKIATMIEEAAPPLEHVANHEPDGSDPIVLPGDISTDQILTWNGTKFVGSDAPAAAAYPSPISIHPLQFKPIDDQTDFYAEQTGLKRRADLSYGLYYAPVNLPHGVTITKLTLYAYRDDSGASINIRLYRCTHSGANVSMANVTADWTDGDGSGYDDSIDYSIISNVTYSYALYCYIDPNDDVDDVKLTGVKIDFI
ncbi:hypothetical protein ES703_10719 [subsurface metagenome]